LWRTANTLIEDKKVLERETSDALKKVTTESGSGFHCFDFAAFLNLQTGLQRRVLRDCYSALRPEIRDIGFELIEKSIRFLRKPPKSKSVDLFGGLTLWVGDDWFMIFDKNLSFFPHIGPQMRQDIRYQLSVPGEYKLVGGWMMISEQIDPDRFGMEKVYTNEFKMTAFVDSNACSGPFWLGTRKPGDRFSPLGMAGKTTKLSDYMINVKIPEVVRDTWPVLISGGDIIWVPNQKKS
jgi:tRNA(Ile)-lysidine synthetase-like protein